MRVKRLQMQSFRGIGDLTIDFDKKEPTVFIGINGVGILLFVTYYSSRSLSASTVFFRSPTYDSCYYS
ncbi:hypothetical protein VB638_08580 [Dolichospermum sp. UHCC 0684]|jgi:recombinational DNA repair ATPase RecF|uniref:hypothetical protein n=1 Tax=Dolichospermum sp. UHCC 0260 TaxID=2590025 RepID=UPI0016908E2C|nr:hypothetical protein [Dolichospermum sp. UHCC 0260]MEA5529646.1 hypothetical protein [Dolichospermum sp. UHCC 0684]MTJ35355.1 hypothetical protein [Dolichospermum sp. UHCC 0260]